MEEEKERERDLKTKGEKQTYLRQEEKKKEEGEERDGKEKDSACLTPRSIAIPGCGLCPSRNALSFKGPKQSKSREMKTKDRHH